MCLDQRMQRDRTCGRELVDHVDGALQVFEAARLRDHQVSHAGAGLAHDGVDHRRELRVVDRQHARADAAEAVGRRVDQLADQLGMFQLATHRRAVFAIERDVEHRPELALKLEALAHARLDAGVVVAHRQRGRGLAAVEQCVARMQLGAHRWLN